ncbi:MAG: IS4 family transposase [Planctomycetota bacterium]|nr:IS4 family transposase [Planctomycetota bacterium]
MAADSDDPKAPFNEQELTGLKYFGVLKGLLKHLHAHRDHPNRVLHYDQYLSLLLLYFFNPVVTSLRGVQFASELEKVQKHLGVKRSSLGSLSEAAQVFDPRLAETLFKRLSAQAVAHDAPRPLPGLPDALAIMAADGTLLEALPRMLWALWRGPHEHAVKLHFQFDISRGVPRDVELTEGHSSEINALAAKLHPQCLYVLDRGYRDYAFFQSILDAGSSFVARIACNAVSEVVEERRLSAEAQGAGVELDQVIWLGWEKIRSKLRQPLRLLKVHVKNPAAQHLKPRVKPVDAKSKQYRECTEEFDLWLLTDRLDLPAESIAQLYRYRWHIEIFFRWFKCVLGCKHLLSQSAHGLRIEIYAALIASLLIVLWTGRKPTKRTLEMLQFHFQGWASASEVDAHIAGLRLAQ